MAIEIQEIPLLVQAGFSSEPSFFPNAAVARSIRFHVGTLRSDMLAKPRRGEQDYQDYPEPIFSGRGFSMLEEWKGGKRHIIFGHNDLVRSWRVHDRLHDVRCEMDSVDASESDPGGYIFTASTTKRTIDANAGLLGSCGDFLEQIDAYGFDPDARMKERMVFDTEGTLLERVVAIGEEGTNKVGWFVRRLKVADETEEKFGYDERVEFRNVSVMVGGSHE